MTREEFIKFKTDTDKNFVEYIKTYSTNAFLVTQSRSAVMYAHFFNKIPICYYLSKYNEYDSNDMDKMSLCHHLTDYKKYDYQKTVEKLLKEYDGEYIIYGNNKMVTPDLIYIINEYESYYVIAGEDFDVERFKKCIVEEVDKPYVRYVTMSHSDVTTFDMNLDVKVNDDNIEKCYNDINRIKKAIDFVNSDESGIMMLHGEPGCGKTSLIRYLKSKSDKKFFWIDESMFNYLNDSRFINFLINEKNSVFILEDCESLIKSREIEKNSLMSMLLNLSDGILSDTIKAKFICTYNTNIKNVIDSALLRNGRMKIDIEIDKLSIEKTKVLLTELGIDISDLYIKPMSLADIFNSTKENIVDNLKHNKCKTIGFEE